MPLAVDLELLTQKIGRVDNGCDGSDEYVLLSRVDKEKLTPEQAHDWLLPRVYHETRQEAGGYFCKQVLVQPVQYSEYQVVAIICHRYDV